MRWMMISSLLACSALGQHGTLAGGSDRVSVTGDPGPASIASAAWVFPASDAAVTESIVWVGPAGPVAAGGVVVAVSAGDGAGGPGKLWAIDRADGSLVWSAALPGRVLDSWSSPTVDRVNGTVLIGVGAPGAGGGFLRAYRLSDGVLAWDAALEKDVVNSTALVTRDRGAEDRVFVTDYEGFYAGGEGGVVYCINVDAFDAALNPYQPGEIVWRRGVFSGLSGATPAYDGERVYVGTAGDGFGGGGSVLAFDAGALDAASALAWERSLGGDDGCFGGVSVRDGFVYAATYDFFGGRDSSRLVKLRAVDGVIQWVASSDRTASIPVPLSDGRVLVSSGIDGFGSAPSVGVYEDLGASAVLSGDFEAFNPGAGVGGWSNQPVVIEGRGVALVGSLAGGLFAGYDRLNLVDLSVPLGGSGSVVETYDGAGSSPAVAGFNAYSIGSAGVHAFGLYDAGDVDLNEAADVFDLIAFERLRDAGDPEADATLDGVVDSADTLAVIGAIDGSGS